MKDFNEKELLLLAYLEGDLDEKDRVRVEKLLASDDVLKKEYALLSKTILPAEAIEYTGKLSLKKDLAPQRVSLAYMLWSGAVAAVLATLLIFYSPTLPMDSKTAVKEETTLTRTKKPDKSEVANNKIKNTVIAEVPSSLALPEVTNKVVSKAATKNHSNVLKKSTPEANKPYKKEQFITTTLSLKPSALLVTKTPNVTVYLQRDLEMLPPQVTSDKEALGWFARTKNKINKTLNTWVDYLQKPKVEISKKKPKDGRIYWAITVEADRYEWEGILYTYR